MERGLDKAVFSVYGIGINPRRERLLLYRSLTMSGCMTQLRGFFTELSPHVYPALVSDSQLISHFILFIIKPLFS